MINNCIKPDNKICLKDVLEKLGCKIKKYVDSEIHPSCALCKWYIGYIEDEDILDLRTKLFIWSETGYYPEKKL